MNRVLPAVASTVQATSADGGLVSRRLRQAGQSGQQRLDGAVVDPGPWRAKVLMAISGPQNPADCWQFNLGFYTQAHWDAVVAGLEPPNGTDGTTYSETLDNYVQPGTWTTVAQDRIWTNERWFGGLAQVFNPFVDDWIGGLDYGLPVVRQCWADVVGGPGDLWANKIDTSQAVPPVDPSQVESPYVDFDYPILGFVWAASGAYFWSGTHPIIVWSDPVLPGAGVVTLYNNIQSHTFPLPFSLWQGKRGGISPSHAIGVEVIDGHFEDAGFGIVSAIVAWVAIDLSQLPDAPTGAIGHQEAGSGLIAVG